MAKSVVTIQHANFFQFARSELVELKRVRSRLLVMVVEGALRIRSDAGARHYQAGEWILSPWLSYIAFRTLRDQPATIATIHFTPETSGMTYGIPPEPNARETTLRQLVLRDGANRRLPDGGMEGHADNDTPLYHAVMAILGHWRIEKPAPATCRQQAAFLIDQLLFSHRLEGMEASRTGLPRCVQSAILWAQQHPTHPLILSRLAEAASVHPATLHRAFRRTFKSSPVAYLTNQRLIKAADWLSGSNRTIQEIANQCGYKDPFHFSRAFKKHYHLAPAHYRREQHTIAGG